MVGYDEQLELDVLTDKLSIDSEVPPPTNLEVLNELNNFWIDLQINSADSISC
jgi:hypothetical protein